MLDRPLAETVVICGKRPPRFVFFAVSGSLCNGAQLALDHCIWYSIGHLATTWWGPTACWTASYALSVALRHGSHSIFVFGPHKDPLLLALGKTYLTYLSTILASSSIHLALVVCAAATHEVALVVTSIFSVVWSYFALSKTWHGEEAPALDVPSSARRRGAESLVAPFSGVSYFRVPSRVRRASSSPLSSSRECEGSGGDLSPHGSAHSPMRDGSTDSLADMVGSGSEQEHGVARRLDDMLVVPCATDHEPAAAAEPGELDAIAGASDGSSA